MLPLRFPRLWLSLGWLAVAIIIVICLAPMEQLPKPPHLSDKSEHFIAYLVLSVCFAGMYQRSRYWLIAIGLLVMGIMIEFAQGAMHLGRQADVLDVIANSTGIVAGLLLCWIGLLVMGIMIEFAQGAMHLGRQADVLDVIANSTGIVAGLLLCWFGLGAWIQWVEALLGKPQVGKS